mmetsp:Transcript_41619/g.61059  ORF Transcript_41619/g.61059 Transcript_41619/m.61059 type:complete len:85 (-) Transcript_41619:233-487(-)
MYGLYAVALWKRKLHTRASNDAQRFQRQNRQYPHTIAITVQQHLRTCMDVDTILTLSASVYNDRFISHGPLLGAKQVPDSSWSL